FGSGVHLSMSADPPGWSGGRLLAAGGRGGIGARLASPILSNKIVPRIAHACAARAEDTPGRLLLCAHIIAGTEGNRERDDNPCQDHTHSPPSPFLMLPKTSIRMAKPVTLSVIVAFPARDFARLQPGPRFGK